VNLISTDFTNPDGIVTGPDTPAGGWATGAGPEATADVLARDGRAAR
jgi:hypothetical protein